MNKFIWIRDHIDVEHYVNVSHIMHVSKVPAHGKYNESDFVVLKDGSRIWLRKDSFDTYHDVVVKIEQAAL